jgi:hypothetical protein
MRSGLPLRGRIRAWTIFFMAGVVLSGMTAIPIATQLDVAVRLLGEDLSAGGAIPPHMSAWLHTLRDGIRETGARAPFMFYGTDWLAFGHFIIALAFIGALRDPVRNRWLFQFGMAACAAVPIWALVFGHVRGVPLWWRMVDASFGIIGFVPMWLCNRWTRALELRGRRVTDL